jgi:hypothetical protein
VAASRGGVVLRQGAVVREATGTKKSGGDGRWYPFKGRGGEAERGGGLGKSADAWRGSRKGALTPTGGDNLGGVAQPAAARPRHARVARVSAHWRVAPGR